LPPGSSLVGFGSPSEFTRTTAATLASRRCLREVLCPDSVFEHGQVGRQACQRIAFDVSTSLTNYHPFSTPDCSGIRSWGSPLEAFSSHLIRTRCRVPDESGVAPRQTFRFIHDPLPAYRLRLRNPTNKFAASRIRFGFWALIPLRIRQSSAGVTPRTIRCSSGFFLSRDFSLPAIDPSSRVFHSPTCAIDQRPTRCRSAVCTAGRSAFPRSGP